MKLGTGTNGPLHKLRLVEVGRDRKCFLGPGSKLKMEGRGRCVCVGDIATWTFKLESARNQQTRGKNEAELLNGGKGQTDGKEKYSYLSDPELLSDLSYQI